MDNNTKNALILSGAAIAGGWGGSWAAARLGATFGISLGPWGSALGAVVGGLLGTTIAKSMLGDDLALPEPDAMLEPAEN